MQTDPSATAPPPAPTAAPTTGAPVATLADRLDAALPQTQCTRCGWPDCRAYAEAIARGEAAINRCPPGGAEGIARLAALTGQPLQPLDPACGEEAPLSLAVIDEAWCIGCTLCLPACPVDCIVGAHKRMHTVIGVQCTGCALCVPACPVDCIRMVPVDSPATGWAAWSPQQAAEARARYDARRQREQRLASEHQQRLQAKAEAKLADLPAHTRLTEPAAIDRKRAVIEAALARARARQTPGPTAAPASTAASGQPASPGTAGAADASPTAPDPHPDAATGQTPA